MKSLIYTIGLLTVINVATSYYTSEVDSSSSSKYLQYLRERSQMERLRNQFEALCPGKDDELDEAIFKLKECSDAIDENTETACSAVKNHFMRCSKPFVELLEKCLPEQSKDLPNLVFQAVNSGVAYICKTDGEHIFELANTCFLKTNIRSLRCERRIKTKLQQYKNRPPTKSDICELAQSLKPCIHTHLQDSCGSHITRESFMGMFDAITAPCKNNNYEFNDKNMNEVEILE